VQQYDESSLCEKIKAITNSTTIWTVVGVESGVHWYR